MAKVHKLYKVPLTEVSKVVIALMQQPVTDKLSLILNSIY